MEINGTLRRIPRLHIIKRIHSRRSNLRGTEFIARSGGRYKFAYQLPSYPSPFPRSPLSRVAWRYPPVTGKSCLKIDSVSGAQQRLRQHRIGRIYKGAYTHWRVLCYWKRTKNDVPSISIAGGFRKGHLSSRARARTHILGPISLITIRRPMAL